MGQLASVLLVALGVLTALLGIGGFLLKLPLWGWGGLVVAAVGIVGLRQRGWLQGGLRQALGQTPQG